MNKNQLHFVILAGGKGERMNSPLAKTLHPVCGVPMLERIIKACKKLDPKEVRVVIPSLKSEIFSSLLSPLGASLFKQKDSIGTADALLSADLSNLDDDEFVFILNADHPLICEKELQNNLDQFFKLKTDFCVITRSKEDAKDYGRVIRDSQGQIRSICEASESTYEVLKIKEVNTGAYIISAPLLKDYLKQVSKGKSVGNKNLSSIVSFFAERKKLIKSIECSEDFSSGVNSQEDLSDVQKRAFRKNAKDMIKKGVTLIDSENTYIEDNVEIGSGSVIFPSCYIKKGTKIGSYCVIESNSWIQDSEIKDHVHVKAGSYIEESFIDSKCKIGPYAHLRPQCHIHSDCKVGNFVEFKNVVFGKKSKASHLTYLGDCEVGEEVNIGCGVVTCNYSPQRKKHKTKIGSYSFIGSDAQLIAPLEVEESCVIAAGSVVSQNVPKSSLYISRAEGKIKKDYLKEKK